MLCDYVEKKYDLLADSIRAYIFQEWKKKIALLAQHWRDSVSAICTTTSRRILTAAMRAR